MKVYTPTKKQSRLTLVLAYCQLTLVGCSNDLPDRPESADAGTSGEGSSGAGAVAVGSGGAGSSVQSSGGTGGDEVGSGGDRSGVQSSGGTGGETVLTAGAGGSAEDPVTPQAGTGGAGGSASASTPQYLEVSIDSDSACAVLSDGAVECWSDRYKTPARVRELAGPATAVAVSANSTNDSACALLMDGRVQCWGSNTYGQLGNGSTDDALTPTFVTGLSDVTAIDADELTTCALVRSGKILCWGSNDSGQLGIGATSPEFSAEPVEVLGIASAIGVSVGSDYACAITDSNQVFCWGTNGYGQLGNGDRGTSATALVPVVVSGELRAKSVSAGTYHTCAVTLDNKAACWGRALSGRVGVVPEGTNYVVTPLAVSELNDVLTVSAGSDRTCAVSTDHKVLCWGENRSRELGNGTTTSSAVPVLVAGDGFGDAYDVVAGGFTSCALREGGNLQCWGE